MPLQQGAICILVGWACFLGMHGPLALNYARIRSSSVVLLSSLRVLIGFTNELCVPYSCVACSRLEGGRTSGSGVAGTGNKHLSGLSFPSPFLEKEESYLLEDTAPADSGVVLPLLILSEFFVSTLFSRDANFSYHVAWGCVGSGAFPLPPPL